MKTVDEIKNMLAAMPEAVLDYPFDAETAVYKIGSSKGKMFALIAEHSRPVRLSLKCDPQLAELLRERYESVLPGYHLNKKYWNTIVCSGQLNDEELQDLIRHSFELVNSSQVD